MKTDLVAFAQLLLVGALLGLPAATGLLLAIRLGVRSRPVQGVFALGLPALIGYTAVWLYLASATIGRAFTAAIWVAAVAAGVALFIRASPEDRRALRPWALVGAMTVAAAAFSLGLGFLRGTVNGVGGVLPTAQLRYTNFGLPPDAKLPYLFALQLLSSHRPLPHKLLGSWLSSDRPPLQSGVYLVMRSVLPYGDPRALLYQVTGTFLQCLWVPAVWCLFGVMRVPRRAAAIGMVVVLTSGFAIVNSFMVWPKLFAAAFLVLLVAVIFDTERAGSRLRMVTGAVCGLAAAMALLGHEGSSILLVPLALIVAVFPSRRPGLRPAGAAVLTGAVLMLPWLLYQHYYDPPGDGLVELAVAGHQPMGHDPGEVRAVLSAYDHLSAGKAFHNKLVNLETPLSNEPSEITNLYRVAEHFFSGSTARNAAVSTLRTDSFFFMLPAMGLFALGPLAWPIVWWRRRKRGSPGPVAVAAWLWLLLAMTLAFWAVVMFKPRATVIHEGSYAIELLFFVAATSCLWYLSRRLTVVLGIVQSVIAIVVYGFLQPPARIYLFHSVGSLGGIGVTASALWIAGLLSFVVLALMVPPSAALEEAPATS